MTNHIAQCLPEGSAQDHKALSVVGVSTSIRSADNEVEIVIIELHSDSKVMLVGDVEDGWNSSAKSPSSVRSLASSRRVHPLADDKNVGTF